MTTQTSRAQADAAKRGNGGYSGFVLAVLAGLLMEAANVQAGVGFAAHLVTVVIAAALAAFGVRRCMNAWSTSTPEMPSASLASPANAALVVVMFAAGFLLPFTLQTTSTTPFLIAAGGLGFIPWSRLALHRSHPVWAASILFSGFLLGLLLGGTPKNALTAYCVAAILWAIASLHFFRGLGKTRLSGAHASGSMLDRL